MNRIVAAAAALAIVTAHPLADAAEVKVWTARAIATVLAEVGPEFERTTGHHLEVSSDLPTTFARRFEAGDRCDVLISTSAAVDEWIEAGRVVPETRTDIARSGIGVAVRAGASKPDLSSVDAFKRALLDAKSIAFLRVGSGLYVADLLERLGIAQAVSSKVTRPDSDAVAQLVASGEVELGLVVITQILTTQGVELAGPLPPEIQSTITFTAGASTRTEAPEAVRQLVDFLTGPTAARVIRAQGMELVRNPGASDGADGASSAEAQTAEEQRDAMLLSADTALAQKRPEDAISVLNDVIAYYETRYVSGERRFYSSRTPAETLLYTLTATKDGKSSTVLGPNWVMAYYLKSFALVELGRFAEARTTLERARAIAPANTRVLSELAYTYQANNDSQSALDLYIEAEQAATFSPEQDKNKELGKVLRGQGYALTELGRLDEATERYRRCLAMDPNDSDAQRKLNYISQVRKQGI